MIILEAPILIAIVVFIGSGILTLGLYWRFLDPWLRKALGGLMRVEITLGEHHTWEIDGESETSTSWRMMVLRPVQMLTMVFAIIVPIFAAIAAVGVATRTP